MVVARLERGACKGARPRHWRVSWYKEIVLGTGKYMRVFLGLIRFVRSVWQCVFSSSLQIVRSWLSHMLNTPQTSQTPRFSCWSQVVGQIFSSDCASPLIHWMSRRFDLLRLRSSKRMCLHSWTSALAIFEFTRAMDSSEDWEEKKDVGKGAGIHPFWSSSTNRTFEAHDLMLSNCYAVKFSSPCQVDF